MIVTKHRSIKSLHSWAITKRHILVQLHQLRALVCVVETGSISAAAKSLELSQPAITRALKQLELSVGATLLSRTAQGVQLTSYGTALLQHARLIVRESVDAQEQIRQMIGDRSGKLAIASSAVPFSLVVPRAVELMRLQFPNVYVHLREAVYPTVMDLFREKSLDFAIGPLPAKGLGDDFRHERLFELDLVVALKHGHPLARAKSLRSLTQLSWMVTGPLHGPGAVHEQAFLDAGLEPPTCVTHCESVGSAFQIIEHSNVASFVPRTLAEEAQAAKLVSIVDVKEKLPSLQISIFLPAQKILTPAGKALYSAVHSVSHALRKRA